MNIILNNNPENFEESSLTISDILRIRKYSFKLLIVKINGKLILKEEYSTAKVQENDDVMILHLVSGG